MTLGADYVVATLGQRIEQLDPAEPAEARRLAELLDGADMVVTDEVPGRLGEWGPEFGRERPGLVQVVITPYGLDGPYADRPATDLTLLAAGGLLNLAGEPDRAPVRPAGGLAGFASGLHATVGGLIALLERKDSGKGQVVDVSAQQAVAHSLENAAARPWPGPSPIPRGTRLHAGGWSRPVQSAETSRKDSDEGRTGQQVRRAGGRGDRGRNHAAARAGEVLVALRAAGLNRIDVLVREGGFAAAPMPIVLGAEGAGEVAEIGPGASGFAPGDRVVISRFGACGECPACAAGRETECPNLRVVGEHFDGTYAEYIALPTRSLLPAPDGLGYLKLAASIGAYMTARHMLKTKAQVRPGETVLAVGAGSGVASAAVQVARSLGATVIATTGSERKQRQVRALGADEVINYGEKPDFHESVHALTGGLGADVVHETVGLATIRKSILSARRGGRLVGMGSHTGSLVELDLRSIYQREITLIGCHLANRAEIAEFLPLLADHTLLPVVDSVFELKDAAAAYVRIADPERFGKVVLSAPGSGRMKSFIVGESVPARAPTAVWFCPSGFGGPAGLRGRRCEQRIQQAGEDRVQIVAAQLVDLRRAAVVLGDHARFAQHAKVIGGGGLAARESDLPAGRRGLRGQRLDDEQPHRVRACVQHCLKPDIGRLGMVQQSVWSGRADAVRRHKPSLLRRISYFDGAGRSITLIVR